MLLNDDYLTVGYANDRASNTEIVGFRDSTQPTGRNLVTCTAYCGVAALSILRLRFNINLDIEIESIQELKQPF